MIGCRHTNDEKRIAHAHFDFFRRVDNTGSCVDPEIVNERDECVAQLTVCTAVSVFGTDMQD